MIPKRGEFGELWGNQWPDPQRATACVNALDGCDPEKLGEFIKAVRHAIEARESIAEDYGYAIDAIAAMRTALDAFTERQE